MPMGRSLNEELDNTNVSVTVSLPGYVRTNIHKRSGLRTLNKKNTKLDVDFS